MPKNKKIDLSVIVPCYNEKDNVPLIVNRFKEVLPNNINAELILVNNGSTDGSDKVMKKLAKKYNFVDIAIVKKNIGYGFGLWTGLNKARGEYICWTHADMQTDLKDTIKAYNIIIKQKEPIKCFVKGSRKGRSFFDVFFTGGMSAFETIMLRKILYDINAQPNLFHRSFLKNTTNYPNDFSFDLYFYYIAKRNRYRVIRFQVLFKERIHGQSRWNTGLKSKWKFIKRTVDFTFKLKKCLRVANVKNNT